MKTEISAHTAVPRGIRGWRRLLVAGLVFNALFVVAALWLRRPDQRFVGTWTVHAPATNGDLQIRQSSDGTGEVWHSAVGAWSPIRWHAKFGHVSPPREEGYSMTARDIITDWYYRVVHGRRDGYDVRSISANEITMTNLSTGDLVTLKRVAK
jgi:hypothetical protein